MTPNWTWTLNSQKYFILQLLTPDAHILVRFALQLAVSEIQHVQGRRKSEMHRMTPTDLEHLAVKSTLDTLISYPWGPNFGLFFYEQQFSR